MKTPPEDIFVIDHHLKSNEIASIEEELKIPEENVLRAPSASSTCEMLANEFDSEQISVTIAEMLTLGLMADTAKLKFLKANTLQNLQVLLEKGADYKKL